MCLDNIRFGLFQTISVLIETHPQHALKALCFNNIIMQNQNQAELTSFALL